MAKTNEQVSRRRFLQIAGATGLATTLPGSACRAALSRGRSNRRNSRERVIVIGIDGLDPLLCEKLMARGKLPNLRRLCDAGGYRRLGTSIPPQSPVAWANFITGADAGVHGIFDFIHRDPAQQCLPLYSAAETLAGEGGWEVGDHRLPLTFWPFNDKAPQTVLRREGTPFWDYLDEAGIPAWIYDIPSNYPPSPSKHGHQFAISGMGTPDLLGGYGTYQYFSSKLKREKEEGGGMRKPLYFVDNVARTVITGPENSLLKSPTAIEVPLTIYRDGTKPIARIEFNGRPLILQQGEWSGWQQLRFKIAMPRFLPDDEITGICRFYLQQVHPEFRLYISPINIDPSAPGGQRISEPPDFVTQVSDDIGLFATTGFQEDHKALSNRVFTEDEYLDQANYVLAERMKLFDYAVNNYDDGLLFFYFSSTDLQAHMFFWDSNEKHPARSADDAVKYHGVVEDLYARMDAVVGDIVKRYGEKATIMVMSDHGFCTFRRQFNLNTWLRENGYMGPSSCGGLFPGPRDVPVDWKVTRAFGMGLNGLYINQCGREREGIVHPGEERELLLEELRARLLDARDPVSGERAISTVYRTDQVYTGPEIGRAPDLIVGYRRGYRSSWATTLGSLSRNVFSDNHSAWSADHCMATEELPGVLFSNKPILSESPTLIDLAPTILQQFGLKAGGEMRGKPVINVS